MPNDFQMLDEKLAQRSTSATDAKSNPRKLLTVVRWTIGVVIGAATGFSPRLVEASGSLPALFAQAEAEAEASGPSYALDSLILFVLVAGAVFAVCRAGRRN